MSGYLFDTLADRKSPAKAGKVVLDDAMLERIDMLYKAGTKRLSGAADWYADTFHNIMNIMETYDSSGPDDDSSDQRAYLFVDLLAATSPQASIIHNTFLTTQVFNFINDAVLCKILMKFEAHLNNVCRALIGLPLSGQKVTAFQANLLGDKNSVTVDVWMMRVFERESDAPTAAEYEDISAAVRKVARMYGIPPANMQAALWVGIKAVEGDPADTPEPFEDTLLRFKIKSDAQGKIDFASAEGKFEATENKLASERTVAANPPEPRYSSPRTIGARLKEIAVKEAGLPGEVVDIICEQDSDTMMEAILFVRDHIDKWTRGKGDPVAQLSAHLSSEEKSNPDLEYEAERILRRLTRG